MVSREGEEAEASEIESPFSTPPRMESIKLPSGDPLQRRLAYEARQSLGRQNADMSHDNYAQCEEVSLSNRDTLQNSTNTVLFSSDQNQIANEDRVRKNSPYLPPLPQGNLSYSILTTKVR